MTSPSRLLAPREQRFERLEGRSVDVVVIGGGITGAGVAFDLSLRGLDVVLVEQGDWASGTSSCSSRLIHGGLRYLEQFQINLVRESCLERALLLKNAAGLVWPERFAFPVRKGDRVGLFRLGLGLTVYSALSIPRTLGLPYLLSTRELAHRIPGLEMKGLRGGGGYLDAATNDARLTLAVVLSAARAGATVLSRVEATHVKSSASTTRVDVRDALTDSPHSIVSKAVVLAGGPATESLRARANLEGQWIQPTRGTHLLVQRDRFAIDGAVIFPSAVDGRIMFLLPWSRFTVLGTTDLDDDADSHPFAHADEVDYLLQSANALAPGAGLQASDVVATYAGLRPLLAAHGSSPSERSREERVERSGRVYTIAGGKLTAFRGMAEKLAARICDDLGIGRGGRKSDTRNTPLVGALTRRVETPDWNSLQAGNDLDRWRAALIRRYGTLATDVESFCASVPGGTQHLNEETRLGEVDWAVQHEDARLPADFLLRRSDVGWDCGGQITEVVTARMAELLGSGAADHELARSDWQGVLHRMHAWRNGDQLS